MALLTQTQIVETKVGDLHVTTLGDGPAAVLWHSLFLDSTCWDELVEQLSEHRTLILIDGPGHGLSGDTPPEFSLADCVAATVQILDELGVTEPVDWVGNAWGGHVGFAFAAMHPKRCGSLVAMCSPVDPLRVRDRMWITPLVLAYRALGPVRLVARVVAGTLLVNGVAKLYPGQAKWIEATLRAALHDGMHLTMRSVMLRRPTMVPMLPYILVPSLLVCTDDDDALTPAQTRSAAAQMPQATVLIVAGGHAAPLHLDAEVIADEIAEFWEDPAAYVRECHSEVS